MRVVGRSEVAGFFLNGVKSPRIGESFEDILYFLEMTVLSSEKLNSSVFFKFHENQDSQNQQNRIFGIFDQNSQILKF